MKRILCAALACLLCLPVFPARPAKAENQDFQTYFYDDFVTGYQSGDKAVNGYENTVGTISRIESEDGESAYMRLVDSVAYQGADFKKDLTSYIKGKPKLVLEFRYMPNLTNKLSNYQDCSGGIETFCMNRNATPRGYYDKFGGTWFETINMPTDTQAWNTATIVYDNEKEERTIYLDGISYPQKKYQVFEGNSYAKTGKFVWSGRVSNKLDGWFDIDYVALYEYQDQFDFVVENAESAETDQIDIQFNFPVKDGATVTGDNFSLDDNQVVAVEKDSTNPRKYTLKFETPLQNDMTYTIQATGITDIDDRQLNSAKTFHTKAQLEPPKTENQDFKTYFYDDFVTGYQPGDTVVKGGYVNPLGKLSRVQNGDNAYMRLVNTTAFGGAGFKQDLTSYIEGKPKLVLEFRYQPNLNNAASNYKDYANCAETFYLDRTKDSAGHKGYFDKKGGTHLHDILMPTDTTANWSTATIVYDNEKEERTIFLDAGSFHDEKYPEITGNNYAKTGKFIWSGLVSNKVDGWFDIDYVALYEYQDQFDFVVENAQNTQTDRINVLFNFPLKAGTEVTADNFSIDGNRVSAVERDPINPRKYTLTFENALANSSAYTIQAAAITDIDGRQIDSSKAFYTKAPELFLDEPEIENFTLGTSGTYKIKVNAVNETADDVNASVFVTGYDKSGKMSGLEIASVSVPAHSDGAVETTVTLDGAAFAEKCSVFVVQSLEKLSPISGKTTYDGNGMTQSALQRDCDAYEGDITVTYTSDFENQTITPKITIDDTKTRDGVFAILKNDGAVSKENLVFADLFSIENGEAELPVKLYGGGTFYGVTSVFKSAEVSRSSFEFFGLDYIAKALPALNAAGDKAAVEQFFGDYAKACSIDMQPYEALTQEGKNYILNAVPETRKELGGSYASMDAFQEKLAGLYQLAAFYYQEAGLAETVQAFSGKIDDAVEALYQNDLSDEAVKAVNKKQKESVCSTEKSFLETFGKTVILTGVETAEHYKQTRKIITDCRQIIGISDTLFEKYNGLQYKEKVDQKLTGVRFETIEQLIQAFSDETDDQKKKEQNNGGSGSGGTSSRPSGNNGQTTWIPNVSDKNTEDPIKKPEEPTITPSPAPSDGYPFDDMENVRWAKSAVRYLHIKKAVQGKGNGKFAPEDTVTRAEFVTMAGKAFELSQKADGANPFKDVTKDAWYHDSILAAYQAGIVSGTESDVFSPDQNITREMAAVILYKLAGSETFGEAANNFADGENISPYAAEAVGKLAGKGIIGGYEDGTFHPNGSLTRAEAAVLIFRLLTAV